MIQSVTRFLRPRSATTPVVAGQSNLRISLAGKLQSVSKHTSYINTFIHSLQSAKTCNRGLSILAVIYIILFVSFHCLC